MAGTRIKIHVRGRGRMVKFRVALSTPLAIQCPHVPAAAGPGSDASGVPARCFPVHGEARRTAINTRSEEDFLASRSAPQTQTLGR